MTLFQFTILAISAIFLLGTTNAATKSGHPHDDLIDVTDKYIITLKPGANLEQHLVMVQTLHSATLATRQDGKIFAGLSHNWTISSFRAYAGHFDNSVVEQIRAHDDVTVVEPDHIMTIAGESRASASAITQNDASYNLNLISHKSLAQLGSGYVYDGAAGLGTVAYIIDTGIDTSHREFQGRATFGYNALKDRDNTDYPGHGTMVAGVIGSKTYGVAKKCRLIAVKVFDGRAGAAAHVIEGLIWAYHEIVNQDIENVAVISMSVDGGDYSKALNDAIDAANNNGVLTVVAAGNHGQDASKVWTTKTAIVVGSTGKTRTAVGTSNFGKTVTLFAPGVDIPTTRPRNSHTVVSGTSFAAPHVSGLLLYFMSQGHMRSNAARKRLTSFTG